MIIMVYSTCKHYGVHPYTLNLSSLSSKALRRAWSDSQFFDMEVVASDMPRCTPDTMACSSRSSSSTARPEDCNSRRSSAMLMDSAWSVERLRRRVRSGGMTGSRGSRRGRSAKSDWRRSRSVGESVAVPVVAGELGAPGRREAAARSRSARRTLTRRATESRWRGWVRRFMKWSRRASVSDKEIWPCTSVKAALEMNSRSPNPYPLRQQRAPTLRASCRLRQRGLLDYLAGVVVPSQAPPPTA